jgi:hypothetical protein
VTPNDLKALGRELGLAAKAEIDQRLAPLHEQIASQAKQIADQAKQIADLGARVTALELGQSADQKRYVASRRYVPQ